MGTKATSKTDEMAAFATFWNHVGSVEQHLRENEDRGLPLPAAYGGPGDETFAQAYEEIRPFLRAFRRQRTYSVPLGVPTRPTPYDAETAHQALMFYLNPLEDLYGSVECLDSREYLAIKAAAQEERRRRQEARDSAKSKRGRVRRHRQELRRDVALLIALLAKHHFPHNRDPVFDPLTQEQVAEQLGWSQSHVSRCFRSCFKSRRGMDTYKLACKTQSIARGFVKKYADGDLDIEAYLEQEDADERDDDADE